MSKQEKRLRIYVFLNAETEPKFICLSYTKQRKVLFFFTEKVLLKEKEEWRTKKNKKKKKTTQKCFNCSRYDV